MTLINRRVPNIVVPKDDNSWMIFYNGLEMNGNYIVLPVPRDDLKELFQISFFEHLNIQFDTLIDEHEEDEISGKEKLHKLKTIIMQYLNQVTSPTLKFYFEKVLYMVDKAIEFDTCVMFYF